MNFGLQGFDGNRPVDLSGGYREARVRTPGPRRASDTNSKLAHAIMAGVGTWDFDGQRVAGLLLSMPTELQRRLASIVWPLVSAWSRMPSHPEHETARRAVG